MGAKPLSGGNPMHGFVRGRIEFAIQSHFDCRVSDDTARRPQVSIFLANRIRTIDPRKVPVPFAPDIAVKVLSASESAIDVNRQALRYLAADTREVWQINYENALLVVQTNEGIRLLRGEAALETPLLPGFSAALSTLLAPF